MCCSISILIIDKYLSKLHLDLFNEITKRFFLSFWINYIWNYKNIYRFLPKFI